jgi:peptide/nickel transport system substrate-binding protein
MVAQRDQGGFDGLVGAWREPTMIDLEEVWHSAPPGVPTSNWIGYANPEVDRLIEEANELADFAAQKPLFDRIQELVAADQPYTFLYESDRLAGISTRIRGAEINSATPYFNLEEWEIAPPGER